jgi:hypothetical protein
MPDWPTRSRDIVKGPSHPAGVPEGYRQANGEMIRRAMHGGSPHSSGANPHFGMRVVYNISSAHIPSLVAAGSAANKPYQNRYDRFVFLGQPPRGNIPLRERIDTAVAQVAAGPGARPLSPGDLYYGALELNGTGVRFFGDVSMVLKPGHVDAGTLVLFRNSYDLSCNPVQSAVTVAGDPAQTHRNAVARLTDWAGRWPKDPPEMAVCKILDGGRPTTRRMTIGIISAGVLEDEDYIEVARTDSFGASELQEIRLAAADAAAEARIADRIQAGPLLSLAELQWRHRRRAAERAARDAGVGTRVVVTSGRERG